MTADDAPVVSSIHRFFTPNPEALGDVVVCVYQEVKGQLILGPELFVGIHVVRANAEDDHILGFKIRIVIAKQTGLGGATLGVVFRVEIENDGLPSEVAEPHLPVVIGPGFKIWCFTSSLKSSYRAFLLRLPPNYCFYLVPCGY